LKLLWEISGWTLVEQIKTTVPRAAWPGRLSIPQGSSGRHLGSITSLRVTLHSSSQPRYPALQDLTQTLVVLRCDARRRR